MNTIKVTQARSGSHSFRCRLLMCSVLTVLIGLSTPLWAQENITETMVDGRASLIAFEKESSIREGLRILAAMYEKNIVPSAQVDGVLGFTKLRDVTFEEAMSAVLGANYVYEDDGHIINVYSKEEYNRIKTDPARLTYKVFTLYYISAAEAKLLLNPFLSANGTIQSSSQAEITVPIGDSIGGGDGGDSIALNDMIVVMDYPERIEKIDSILRSQIDVRPQQVLVEATIMSVTLNEETKFGINWSDIAGTSVSITTPGVQASGFTSLTDGLKIGISSNHAGVLIEALETISDTTLLAHPNVLAVNKQLGQVYIGKKIGYKDQTTISDGGNETSSVEFLETGTKLSFRPFIGNDGFIRMDIYPKDSSGEINADTGVPDETSTELKTNIMVRDGQTIVIGGLFRTVKGKATSQIPVLGSLPLIGSLFRGTTDSNKREEVIIMLTPRIVEDPLETEADMAMTDIERRQVSAIDNFGLFTRGKIVEKTYLEASKAYVNGDVENALRHVNSALAIRPNYLEAIRLKERIIAETDPEAYEELDRIIIKEMDWQEEASWK